MGGTVAKGPSRKRIPVIGGQSQEDPVPDGRPGPALWIISLFAGDRGRGSSQADVLVPVLVRSCWSELTLILYILYIAGPVSIV